MNGSKRARKPKGITEAPARKSRFVAPAIRPSIELSVANEELHATNKKLDEKTRALASANAYIDADRHRLQDLFELAPDGYLVTDKFGAILEANRAVLQLLNWPATMLAKTPLPMFICKEDRPTFRKKLAALTKSPLIESLEVHIQPFRSDTRIPVSMRVAPIQDERLRVVGLRWLLRDMTEQLKLVEALRHSESLLAERKRELEAVNDLILSVGTSLDLSTILDTVSDVMERRLGVPAGVVLLYKEPENGISLKKTWGLSTQVEGQLHLVLANHPEQQIEAALQLQMALDLSIQVHLASIKSVVPEWKQCLLIQLWGVENIKGLIYLFSANPLIADERQAALYRAVGQQIGAAIQNAHLYEDSRLRQAQLQYVSKQVVEAQEIERRTVARELHDEIGQSLTGLKLFLEANGTRADGTEKAVGMVNELIDQVRNMSLNLRPSMLDDLGVLPTLLWHFRRYTAQTGVKVSFQHSAIDRRFGPEVETATYRIVQEALTNVARYAEVEEVSVCLEFSGTCLNINIDDEGRGFDLEAMRGSYRSAGLDGMAERALALGGELKIESEPQSGVHISACLPITNEPVTSNGKG